MRVDEDMVRQLCRLARIELEAEELKTMTRELGRILAQMGLLAHLPTGGQGEETGGPNVLRTDLPSPSLARETVLALAPQTDGRNILVPAAMEGDA